MWESDSANVEPSGEPSDAEPNTTESSDAESVEERRVRPDVAENLRTLFGTDDRPETFGGWLDTLADTFGDDWPPDVPELCHDEDGRHRAETDDETYRFVCVLDAILLPFLVDESVEVYSAGPETGETVTSAVSQAGIETDPEDAVLSFGVASVEPGTEVTARLTYETMCPYIHAFPDRDAYEQWDERTDAPTTAMPLSDGFALARAMARA
ncbi:organomercurial lyase [Halorussus aquaticus]|uniref:Organomercurial lyase n=1 Tax=Halorussus aquaticus TaxID=2953748 RepID=A0ABD5Q804_9EURY|nr:organomercurial lyase [Halorussus aquaticus]